MSRTIAVLIFTACFAAAAPALAQSKRGTGKNGESCTYELCMSNCIAASGKQCSLYCDKTLKDRKASGVCK